MQLHDETVFIFIEGTSPPKAEAGRLHNQMSEISLNLGCESACFLDFRLRRAWDTTPVISIRISLFWSLRDMEIRSPARTLCMSISSSEVGIGLHPIPRSLET